MCKRAITIFVCFILAGCSSALMSDVTRPTQPQPDVVNTATEVEKQANLPTPWAGETPAPTETQAAPGPTAASAASLPVGTPVLTQSSGSLTVQIFTDEDVEVSDPKFLISGTAPKGTVLSINDDIAVVNQSQAFSVWVPLDEGPNLIEIVASDDTGDEVNFMITVTYVTPQ